MLIDAVEVYRSPRESECAERAFMLTAVGLANEITWDGHSFVIWVDPWAFREAHVHLAGYTHESRPPPPPPPPPELHSYAWVGCVGYVLMLFGVAYALSKGFWRLDAFDVGAMNAARVKSGEWWRAWTALTLHLDPAHLVMNLGAGVWFGYLAGQRLGSGIAWALIVTGAAAANLLEGLLGPAAHRAVGASTAVFTALGLLSAYAWSERFRFPQRWALRWGPLVAGVVLLGWTGSEGENTDLVAHVAGFVIGTLLGALAAQSIAQRILRGVPQWAAGLFALASVGLAWVYGLSR
jgi:rhomboid protease GluP